MTRQIMHIITGLDQGGAERQLSALLTARPQDCVVFSILCPGVMAKPLLDAGVPVYSGKADSPWSLGWYLRLRNVLRQCQPDLVMGWMYHGNIAASITRIYGHKGPVFWNVRHSITDISLEKRSTRWVIKASSLISHQPEKIVYNSGVAAAQHEALGYRNERRIVLPNGFNTEKFRPSEEYRRRLREDLGVTENQRLLGIIGRSHPMKNHKGWLLAAKKTIMSNPQMRCVIIGRGVPDALRETVIQLGLGGYVFLRESTSVPESVYPALDLLVMPSAWGEGFPNVVGEAMSCEVPALVTPVGDAPYLVGDTGFVAEGATPEQLATAACSALDADRAELSRRGQSARQRVISDFSLEKVSREYEELFGKFKDHGA